MTGRRVSVVVVAYRSGAALARCLDSLAGQDADVETIVVDNGALDGEVTRAGARDGVQVVSPAGNVVHVAGFAWVGGYGEPVETAAELRDVPFASGAALAVRADTFRALGGFTEELFLYGEDLELAWRARMHGLRVVMNPRADVFHDYNFERNAAKRYFLERNRLVFVLSAFSGRLLWLLAPVLLAAEVATAALALREHWLKQKLRAWGWILGHARWLRRHRRETQALRQVPDRDLAPYLTAVLDPTAISAPGVVTACNRLMAGYWRLARRAL